MYYIFFIFVKQRKKESIVWTEGTRIDSHVEMWVPFKSREREREGDAWFLLHAHHDMRLVIKSHRAIPFLFFFIFTITSPPPLFIMSAVCSPHWTLLHCLWSPKWCIAPYCFCFYFLKRSHLSSVLFYIKLLIEIYDKRINLVFYIIRTGLKNIRATLLWTNFYMETGDWSLESGVPICCYYIDDNNKLLDQIISFQKKKKSSFFLCRYYLIN